MAQVAVVAWYVFALVDAVPAGAAGKGLTGALSLRELAGAFVVVERRADVPPIAFGALKTHQDVVSRLAKHVPAILPVRFGTLLESAGLEDAVEARDEEIAEAFDLVRDRVQFTWRAGGGRSPAAGGRRLPASAREPSDAGYGELSPMPLRGAAGGAGTRRSQPRTGPLTSGADYLRRAARAANPAPPAAFRALRAGLAPLTVRQRYQPATASLPEAVYHLVEKSDLRRYAAATAAIRKTSPRLSVTGPFPPYAFAPEIL